MAPFAEDWFPLFTPPAILLLSLSLKWNPFCAPVPVDLSKIKPFEPSPTVLGLIHPCNTKPLVKAVLAVMSVGIVEVVPLKLVLPPQYRFTSRQDIGYLTTITSSFATRVIALPSTARILGISAVSTLIVAVGAT